MNLIDKTKTILMIPLYNHCETICSVVERALGSIYPVLVVDDGSTDDGLERIKHLDCYRVRLPLNKGKGEAILAGARFAADHGFSAMLTIDADGQHNPLEAGIIVAEASNGLWPAIIIGARQMGQESVPGVSRFGMRFSNFWVRLECGIELDDTQSGMRLYPVNELLSLELKCRRYDFEIEVLVKAIWAGVDARSVPVSVYYPPARERVSHFGKFIDNLRLTRLHTVLVIERLLPLPSQKLVTSSKLNEKKLIVKNPWQTLKNLCLESSTPFWLAVSVWIGIFLGALPLITFHTIAIIYVTYRFQLNKIAAVAASQFCMPPVIPALCIEVGYFMRTGRFLLDLSWERWLLEVHHRLWEWFLGSLVVGPIMGIVGAVLVYWSARSLGTGTDQIFKK